jgi:hypothetical protein
MQLLDDLKEVRLCASKGFSSRDSKKAGEEDFENLSIALQIREIDNDSNRDVELEEKDTLINKLSHLIRFVSGIASKSQMLITIIRNGLDDAGYIRDDGTLSGLALRGGEYYDKPTLTPNEIVVIIDSIKDEYGVSSIDSDFIDKIETVFSDLSEEKRKLPISWKEIVEYNDDIKEFYFATTLSYEINLLTLVQHSKDMRNANLQPNPWLAFQYYWVPNKLIPEYKTVLLGTSLFEFVSDKPGLAFSSPGKIMGKLNPKKLKMKKVKQLKPLVLAYCGSQFCDTLADMKIFWKMVAKFNAHENPKVYNYWSKMFKRFVKEVSYSDVVSFYEEKYKKTYQHSKWNGTSGPNQVLKKLIENTKKKTSDSIMKFNISRDEDNGICFLTYAIWCKETYGKGWDVTIELIVNRYISILEGSLSLTAKVTDPWTTGVYPVWEALSMGYIQSAIESRCVHIFYPMMDDVATKIYERKQDRYHASKLRSKSLTLHYDILNDEMLSTRITLFPLSSNGSLSDVITINFGKGDGLHWLHPNDDENNAKDGFLGIVGDNLVEPFKSMDWTPFIKENSNYWKMLFAHNEDKIDSLESGSMKKKIERSIDVLEYLSELNLNV